MKISVLPLLGYVPFGMNSAVELPPFFCGVFATKWSRPLSVAR
jgi:hypothetical protein